METFLKRNGFDVLTADDGQKGLDLIKEVPSRPYSPGHNDGDHLFRARRMQAIRSDPGLKTIPIIGISGIGDEMGIQIDKWGDGRLFQVDEFFEKPVDREKLLNGLGSG